MPNSYDVWDLLLYQILDTRSLNEDELDKLLFAKKLLDLINKNIEQLPKYQLYNEFFRLDLKQIFLANTYHMNLTLLPTGKNRIESRQYGHYNMGLIAAYMIDLMASEEDFSTYLGDLRQLFYLAQRHSRISNICYTYKREIAAEDCTNELPRQPAEQQRTLKLLRQEQSQILHKIRRTPIKSTKLNPKPIGDSLEQFDRLHAELQYAI